MRIDRALTALALTLVALPAAATAKAAAPVERTAQPRIFRSEGQGTFGGTKIRYAAAVEEFLLPGASIFATSYIRSDIRNDTARPVVFAFNGGPGSASLWLHLGVMGPRRVDFDDERKPRTVAPFATIANPDSPLDIADIVLIDPPGTGYSRVLPGGKVSDFYGVEQDARAMVQVVQQWLRRHGRANSPKFLVSESYGTVRAAVMARMMAGGPTQTGTMDALALNGILLLGQAMNMAGGGGGEDRAYLDILPSLAATACHFGKVAPGCTPEGQVEAARRFIDSGYLAALYAGSRLPADRKEAVAREMAALIGLPEKDILAADLRISGAAFAKLLLADKGRRLGMYDARFTLPLQGAGGDPVADDPAMGQYVPAFVGAWADYATHVLKVGLDIPYEPIAFRDVNGRWDYGLGPGVPPGKNYALDLAAAMNRNPAMRVMVGTGYYDLVTPLGSADYALAHAGVPLERTSFHHYASGHGPYLGVQARTALVRDLRAFLGAAQ
ncbi:S10 family peptidase [Sphingomonas lycopersici]|uniref:Peptidase S10 n=1 Tax=Sphingomonas lycopersici TaxID=2951807 RepID=A0AA41ZAD7_9SPHN|nr:peptidase S10 [Sphingomonas lycopersici]MCW6535928.1 peptidase S10 [Sphingomonas lycopersici]